MGSCFSKKKKNPSPANGYFPEKSPVVESHTLLGGNPIYAPHSPPPPPVPVVVQEEETVKEVVPVLERESSFFEIDLKSSPNLQERREKEEEEETTPTTPTCSENRYSEICSLSETVSTATIAEKKGEGNGCDEVEMRPPKDSRSPARYRRKWSASDDFRGSIMRGAKSPAITPVLEVGQSPMRSRGFRRYRGENSGRRSWSPANRKDVGRTPSGRMAGRAPAKETEDWGRKMEESEEAGAASPPASKESLENPLVSLECFIFL